MSEEQIENFYLQMANILGNLTLMSCWTKILSVKFFMAGCISKGTATFIPNYFLFEYEIMHVFLIDIL